MKLILMLLLVLPAVLFTLDNGKRLMSYAEDPIEDEIDVEGEADIEEVSTTEDEDEDEKTTASPDADTYLLFIKPIQSGSSQLELPAGIPVEFLVGFRNKGNQDFVLETLEASFRYPMDFNFYIQNFSAIPYSRMVQPNQEATLAYSFIPAEAYAGRPFGLNINLAYRDTAGNSFQEAVFNETVQIVELEEGLDGETFFLYVFLAAGIVLLLVVGQQTLITVSKKHVTRKPAPVETGTSNPNNVDFDWLPKQTLASLNKEKQKSPKTLRNQQSPRSRKVKRTTGSE